MNGVVEVDGAVTEAAADQEEDKDAEGMLNTHLCPNLYGLLLCLVCPKKNVVFP